MMEAAVRIRLYGWKIVMEIGITPISFFHVQVVEHARGGHSEFEQAHHQIAFRGRAPAQGRDRPQQSNISPPLNKPQKHHQQANTYYQIRWIYHVTSQIRYELYFILPIFKKTPKHSFRFDTIRKETLEKGSEKAQTKPFPHYPFRGNLPLFFFQANGHWAPFTSRKGT